MANGGRGLRLMADPQHQSMQPRPDVPRSAFDIQYSHKTTFQSGVLVPVHIDEVLPGDSIRLKMTALARLATPIVPVMDNMRLDSFFFFVPYRLVWDNWRRFMGEQLDPTDSTEFLVPQINVTAANTVPGQLYDYFGIAHLGNPGPSYSVSALPFRAYNLIWNEFFRDQDLQTPLAVAKGDGPDGNVYVMQRRGKRQDYFTSCRPWPQKPSPVELTGMLDPIRPGGAYRGSSAGAPVSGIGMTPGSSIGVGWGARAMSGGRSEQFPFEFSTGSSQLYTKVLSTGATGGPWPDIRVLVNDMRTAHMIQALMEKNATGGTRYTEIVRKHFGVTSPDFRLQRPEYLGGGRAFVTVNPVAQTAPGGPATTVLGELGGVGTAVASNHGFSSSFVEHGIVIGLVCVTADLTYQQGTARMWFRRNRYDFYWPGLAHLGEQAVYSREIYADGSGTPAGGDGDYSVFGYNERWSEYRSKVSRVSGLFRSGVTGSLDIWHLGQRFLARPELNWAFMEERPPVDRVLQVTSGDASQFLFDSLFDMRLVRPLPMFSVPGMGPRL